MRYRAAEIAMQLLCTHVGNHPRDEENLSAFWHEVTEYLNLLQRRFDGSDFPCSLQWRAARSCVRQDSYRKTAILCLEDGKEVKNLARHLKRFHQMDFSDYCRKWDLPEDYPSECQDAAPDDSRQRNAG